MTGKLFRWAFVALALAPALVALVQTIAPDLATTSAAHRGAPFAPPGSHLLGADYLGRPFAPVLCSATAATVRIAVLGTALVVLGCLVVGVAHGSVRSRGLEGVIAAGSLGAMAVPEAAVLITLATAWPRLAPAAWVNASMVAVLVAFAIPPGARLIADRVRAVGRAGFVAASRAYGASPAHTFRHEVWPHLAEDVAWLVASVLPRFVAVEVGLAYLGVEYRDFEGLGKLLAKSFSNLGVETAVIQMMAVIAVVLWVALLPQVVLRALGVRVLREATA